MRRGDIHTVAGGKDYAGKPRPAVIVQDDSFDATGSVTIGAFTTDPTEAPLFRRRVEPNERNGLRGTCRLMVDKITTVPKAKIGAHRTSGRRGHPAPEPRRPCLFGIGSAEGEAAALRHDKGRIDEALLFVQRASLAKLVSNIHQHPA